MEDILLNGEWNLTFSNPKNGRLSTIPATVPGNVELDLQKAQIIGNPIPQDNPTCERWIAITDWIYERDFLFNGLPKGCRNAILDCQGIDTIADVFLNDEKILECANMFVEHQADITDKLQMGVNHIKIAIRSAEIESRKYIQPPFVAVRSRPESCYIRKAHHCWGWDNAPIRLTAGIWRDIAIRFLPETRFVDVYAYTEDVNTAGDSAELGIRYTYTTPDRDLTNYRLDLKLAFNGHTEFQKEYFASHVSAALTVNLPHPKLWFPAGNGTPNLYDLTLTLRKNGRTVARHTRKFGVRTLYLVRSDTTDASGSGEFQFYCNGQKIYVRGTNWKPLSCFHSQTPQRMERALDLALKCNCNMIRVWGGGVYEDTPFFDYCDAHGLMVWQDFMIACQFPPQDKEYLENLEQEAEKVVLKFRNHPSLALWCGDNEVDDLLSWGHMAERNLFPSDNQTTRRIFPNVIRNLDPARCFLPSSPYVADSLFDRRLGYGPALPLQSFVPEHHAYYNTLPKGGFREAFKDCVAHFISETGPIGVNAMSESPDIIAPEIPRLKRLWNAKFEQLEPQDSPNDAHQCDFYCLTWIQKTREVLTHMFQREFSPERLDELVAAVNFYVSDLFKHAVESWRIQKYRRTGIIWWSLMDMWPMAFNYSVCDVTGRPKLPYDVLRLSQQPFALMARDPENDSDAPELYAVNDTLQHVQGTYQTIAEDGTVLAAGSLDIAPNSNQRLGTIPLAKGEFVAFSWKSTASDGRNFYLRYGEPYDFERCRKWSQAIRSW